MLLRAMHRAGPAAGITVVGLGLLAALLVPAGLWYAWSAVPAAAAIALLAWRVTPALEEDSGVAHGKADREPGMRGSWPPHVVTAWLVLAFTAWTAVTHSEHVVLRRDGGAYSLYTQWIATRHGLPVAADLAAFGGPAAFELPRFTLHSPAFYQVLTGSGPGLQAEIVPQFLVGAPAAYSLGWWGGSALGAPWLGMQIMPAALTGLALLAFAGLVRRLIGEGWAPLGVALLGTALPIVQVARTTYSEPVALLALLAGAALAVDAFAGRRRGLALLAGAVIGLAGVIRVDAVREVALVVAVCAVLAARRNPVAPALAGGALGGTGVSLLAWRSSGPYVDALAASLRPLLAATALIVVVAAVAVPLARRRVPTPRPVGRWPLLATIGVLALGAVLVSRPLWLTVRQDPDDPGSRFVALLQSVQGLEVDGGRTYAEHSMQWVAWYVGWPSLVAAWVVLAVLTGRAVGWWRSASADSPPWLVPAAVAFGSTLLMLYRPGITPDHPWASRRLVTVVIPMVVLATTAAIRWGIAHRPARVNPRGAALVTGALALVPTLWATGPLVLLRSEHGEVDAVQAVCRTLRPGDVVVAVDATPDGRPQRSANEWVQVVRGVCRRPSGALLTPAAQMPQASARLAAMVQAAGGRLVLLTAQENDEDARRVLALATGTDGTGTDGRNGTVFGEPRRAVWLQTLEDRKRLADRPASGGRLIIDVWTVSAESPTP